MVQIFISYSRENLAQVERLRNDLRDAGINIWIDKVGLRPGTPDWDQALRDVILKTTAVLLIASPASRRSPYVRDELALARAANKAIYPVWIDGLEWIDSIPMGLGSTQFVDLRDENYAENLPDLIAAIHGASSDPTAAAIQPTEAPPPTAKARNPYKGLRAFRAEDQGDFFGREVFVQELLSRLAADAQSPRLLAVLGASGSGKSSIMMAGLLPKLREAHPEWVYLDPLVPGTHPLENLTIVLARHLKQKSQASIHEDLTDRSMRGLHRLGAEISDQPVAVYIDQFEELFTLVDQEAERRQFIDLVTTAVTEPGGRLRVLLSMRADFYDRPAQYREFGLLIEKQHLLVTPMTLADLYDVVQKPAALPDVGLVFDEDLVTEMVFAVREEAAALPLLQFALDELFQRREGNRLSMAVYQSIGGVQGALAQHAEATYQNLPSAEHKDLARSLFLRLIEAGQNEQDTTRRRANFSELILTDSEQTRILQETANAFVNARLLVSDQGDTDRSLEVSHEALIREWERLGDWVRDAREDCTAAKIAGRRCGRMAAP